MVQHIARTSTGCARSRPCPCCGSIGGLPGAPGEFVGVDIFFVISGYLITRIISRNLAARIVQLRPFLSPPLLPNRARARGRRVVTLAVGYLLLVPGDLVRLCRGMQSTVVALGNRRVIVLAGVQCPGVDDVPTDSAMRAQWGHPPLRLDCLPARVPLNGAMLADYPTLFAPIRNRGGCSSIVTIRA